MVAITYLPVPHMHQSQQQVYDGYPKARIHLLLMPKPTYLAANAVTDLRREHLDRYVFSPQIKAFQHNPTPPNLLT